VSLAVLVIFSRDVVIATDAKTESRLSPKPPHLGHETAKPASLNFFLLSKRKLHSEHSYSYIGIITRHYVMTNIIAYIAKQYYNQHMSSFKHYNS